MGEKENLKIKFITMIDAVMGWFKKLEYNNKCATTITNVVETICLNRYPWRTEIMYDQG